MDWWGLKHLLVILIWYIRHSQRWLILVGVPFGWISKNFRKAFSEQESQNSYRTWWDLYLLSEPVTFFGIYFQYNKFEKLEDDHQLISKLKHPSSCALSCCKDFFFCNWNIHLYSAFHYGWLAVTEPSSCFTLKGKGINSSETFLLIITCLALSFFHHHSFVLKQLYCAVFVFGGLDISFKSFHYNELSKQEKNRFRGHSPCIIDSLFL